MRDDGRLWTMGALGLVAAAGLVRRRSGSRAWTKLGDVGWGGDWPQEDGGFVVQDEHGRAHLIWVEGRHWYEPDSLLDRMIEYVEHEGIDVPTRVLDPQDPRHLEEYLPLSVYDIDLDEDLTYLFDDRDGRTPIEQAAEWIETVSLPPDIVTPQRLVAMATSTDPMDRAEIYFLYVQVHGSQEWGDPEPVSEADVARRWLGAPQRRPFRLSLRQLRRTR